MQISKTAGTRIPLHTSRYSSDDTNRYARNTGINQGHKAVKFEGEDVAEPRRWSAYQRTQGTRKNYYGRDGEN